MGKLKNCDVCSKKEKTLKNVNGKNSCPNCYHNIHGTMQAIKIMTELNNKDNELHKTYEQRISELEVKIKQIADEYNKQHELLDQYELECTDEIVRLKNQRIAELERENKKYELCCDKYLAKINEKGLQIAKLLEENKRKNDRIKFLEGVIEQKSKEYVELQLNESKIDLKEVGQEKYMLLLSNNHLKYIYYETKNALNDSNKQIDILKEKNAELKEDYEFCHNDLSSKIDYIHEQDEVINYYKEENSKLKEQLKNGTPEFIIGEQIFFVGAKRKIKQAIIVGIGDNYCIIQCKNRMYMKLENQCIYKDITDAQTAVRCYYANIKKNYEKDKLSNVYGRIKQRCYNKSSVNYHNYGGRGIKMCDEWKNSYKTFKKWALENGYKEEILENGRNKWTIDRIDNDGDYCPENCRWVTNAMQQQNRRAQKYLEERK